MSYLKNSSFDSQESIVVPNISPHSKAELHNLEVLKMTRTSETERRLNLIRKSSHNLGHSSILVPNHVHKTPRGWLDFRSLQLRTFNTATMVGASSFASSRPKKVEKVLSYIEQAVEAITPGNANNPSAASKNPLSKKSQRVVDAINTGINMGKTLFDRLKGKPKPDNNPYPSLRQTQKAGKQEVGVIIGSADGGASREESLRNKTPAIKEHTYQPLKSNPLTLSEVEFINATREYFEHSWQIELTSFEGAKALAELEGTTNASGSTTDLRSRKSVQSSLVICLISQAGLQTQEEPSTGSVGASAAAGPTTSTESQEHVQNRIMADIVIDKTLTAFEERQAARAKGQRY